MLSSQPKLPGMKAPVPIANEEVCKLISSLSEPESESEPSDDSLDAKFNPLAFVSDETVRQISRDLYPICPIHTTDQCLVRCIQCLESFCSSLACFDIHSEVDHSWSCRSCLLRPNSIYRDSKVGLSAAMASSCNSNSESDTSLIKALVNPVVRGPLLPATQTLLPTPETKEVKPKVETILSIEKTSSSLKRKSLDNIRETEVHTPITTCPLLASQNPSAGLYKAKITQPSPATAPSKGQSFVAAASSLRFPPAKRARPAQATDRDPVTGNSNVKLLSSGAIINNVSGQVTAAALPQLLPAKLDTDADYVNSKGGKRLKRFRCEFCPKRFDQRSNLTAHIRSHTGEKPFTCKVCKRPFSQKSNMTRHMKVHRR